MQLRQRRDARIPRRRVEFADGRVRSQRPGDRVFPPAATDHKYSHAPGAYLLTKYPTALSCPCYKSGRSWRVWSRRGPTPIALTGAPERSSIALT